MDKLLELQNMSKEQNVAIQVVDETNIGTIPTDFTYKIRDAKNYLKQIQAINDEIQKLILDYRKASTSVEERQIENTASDLFNKQTVLSEHVKSILDYIKNDIDKTKKYQDATDVRMKEQAQSGISSKAKSVFEEIQQAQMGYKTAQKNKIKKNAKTYLGNNIPEEQLDELAEDPQLFQKQLQEKMQVMPSIQLQNYVADIEQRNKEIIELEKNVQTIVNLLRDIATLVQQQGELIDNIQINVNKAHDYVQTAEQHQTQAKKYHVAARKKMCCIMIILLIIALIIIIPIVFVSS